MRKGKNSFVYSYEFENQYLFEKLNNRSGCYHNYGNSGDYLIEIKDNNSFFLGIERRGHSGYWFIANISENDGKTIISGDIVFDPDENGNPKFTNKLETFTKIIFYIFFWPIMILNFMILFFLRLFNKVPKVISREKKLDSFMINYLCCSKITK